MPTIYIDNKPYRVPEGKNLLDACLGLGFNLPYFCWHPAMHSVGACRQCAVKEFKDERDTRGKIVMSCMTGVREGGRYSIEDPEAVRFRRSVIEWLMVNHPHDCPVCDEGSECHLQDMTVMAGHTYRRYRGRKRTFRNQDLGPFVNHEMNRCIQCYRCVRFYRDLAGGGDLEAFSSHNLVYFGRHEDGALASEFAGNLVEVCPTGVFTDKTFRNHYSRKWDLQSAPSVCVHCGLGCNTIPGERYNALRRIRNRYNGEVNGYFLCDRGRYGYEFVNGDKRVRGALLDGVEIAAEEAVFSGLQERVKGAKGLLGIGSPRASLESNFALREFVGADNFHLAMTGGELKLARKALDILLSCGARSASLKDVREADAVLILAEDVSNTAPMLAFYIRQAARNEQIKAATDAKIPYWDDTAVRRALQDERGPLFVSSVKGTRLDGIARHVYRAAPEDIALLGFAVAHGLDPDTPGPSGLRPGTSELARNISAVLKTAGKPLVVSGTGPGSEDVLEAARAVTKALSKYKGDPRISLVFPESNSLGVALMGGSPVEGAIEKVQSGKADTVVVLESDLFRALGSLPAEALLSARQVIVIDHIMHATSSRGAGTLVLPAATFAEADGTLVNNEGRAQRFYRVFVPEGRILESWRWLEKMIRYAGGAARWDTYDDIVNDLAARLPVFRPIREIAPPAGFRIAGMKIPRQPQRWSGRAAITANLNVHEPRTPEDPDTPLAFTMEGAGERLVPAPLIPRFWAPGWNSPQALNKFQQEVGGPLRGGDPGARLIEPRKEDKTSYPAPAFPKNFVPGTISEREGKFLFVAAHYVFGSEELSAIAPAVRSLSPGPHLLLSPGDAKKLKAAPGAEAVVELNETVCTLRVRLEETLAEGLAAIPEKFPGLGGTVLPSWGRVSVASAAPGGDGAG